MDELVWLGIAMFTIYLLKVTIKGTTVNTGNKHLKGKLVIITGANSGIGYEVALEVAKRGGRVILACRNETRGVKAQNDIRRESGYGSVYYRQLDLSSFASIREFTSTLKAEEKSLYSLVNNAGLFWVPYLETKDGLESNFGVNHLGHFLLTVLLLPLLEKEHSRIVFVGSLMYMFGKIDFNDVNSKNREYNFVRAYADSKLANLLTCRELSRRLVNQNIRTYCADPGVVATKIGKDSTLMSSTLYRYILQPAVMSVLMRTPAEGAVSSIYCVCSDEVAHESGRFYTAKGVEEPWASGLDEKAAQKLWDMSLQLTKLGKDELSSYVK